eukprot:CAMPEP_0206185334 /NCGR_PEP_ID=MMETSP0166-20121206/1743_1 /ASSEMBLY_ACC=CAM_ASM_000260 /TAXON_ID=95228 /ORGANISM="Vannella robusta, Strain DIVA3 518/3/11/1/6" /LENGTH=175 /DNA_ID=CAMNT_0053600503 /DNA_START=116 /DNA_END=643 /DNA_ORIENTATION=-
MTADEVPHPHEFTDGDPMPHLREALSHGPRSINDSVAPELDQLSQDICSLNMVELVQVNYLLCKKLGIDPDILSIIKGALQSGGGGGESAAESTATKETGFRSISLREVPTGVKERFPIMKLMRAEDEKLSLADCKKALESDPPVLFTRIDKDKAEEIVTKLTDMGLVALTENVE